MKESLHVFGEIWEQLGKCLKSGLGKSEKSHKSSYFKHWNVGTSESSQGNVTSQGHLVARGGLQRVAGGKQVEGCCLYLVMDLTLPLLSAVRKERWRVESKDTWQPLALFHQSFTI